MAVVKNTKYLGYILIILLFPCILCVSFILLGNVRKKDMDIRSEGLGCQEEIKEFDELVERSKLPFDNPESLCYKMNMSTNFEELEPKFAIAKLIGMELGYKYSLVFEGIDKTETINIPLTDQEAEDLVVEGTYQIDMNNICRNFFALADSRYPSPILETFHKPEAVSCK